MFSKATFIAAFVALSGVVSAATPPPCLLAAVNTQQNPGDLKNICGNRASDVQKAIAAVCGSDTQSALSSFSESCSGAGVKVASYTVSSASGTSLSTSSGATASRATLVTVPTTIVYTSAYLDPACNCTKTSSSTATSMVTSASSGTAIPSAQITGTGTVTAARTTSTSGASASATGAAAGAAAGQLSVAKGAIAAVAMMLGGLAVGSLL